MKSNPFLWKDQEGRSAMDNQTIFFSLFGLISTAIYLHRHILDLVQSIKVLEYFVHPEAICFRL